MTECSGGGWAPRYADNLRWNTNHLFMKSISNYGQIVILWNMALDEHHGPRCHGGACCKNCRGVLTIPSTAKSFQDVDFNVEFVALAHHSAFVRRGARRVLVEHGHTKLKINSVAYENPDGGMVLVVLNDDTKSFLLQVVISHKESFRFNVPPGVVTFVWP